MHDDRETKSSSISTDHREYGCVSARQATRGGLRDTRHVLAKAASSQPAARLRSLAAETNFCFDDSLEIGVRYTCVFGRIICD